MTTQTTLSDAELIVKGYNAILEDAQYEFEEVKEEVLLQLEDLDDEFETYREFELRLEAYENGAFDPDIEKILGIGGRKAGTWNPLSQRARTNRKKERVARDMSDEALSADDTTRGEKADEQGSNAPEKKKPGLQPIDATQFKGRQPGGGRKGATRNVDFSGRSKADEKLGGLDETKDRYGQERTQYRGGDLSDRDTFAGAIARKVIGGRKKLGEAKGKLDQRENIGRKIGAGKDKIADTAAAGKGKAQSGGSKVAGVVSEVGRRGKVASSLVSGGVRSAKDVVATGKVQPRIYDPPKPIDKKKANQPKPQPAPVLSENKPSQPTYSPTGKRLFYGADGSVTKSFTDRLRKSMGYRPRREYDDRLPW